MRKQETVLSNEIVYGLSISILFAVEDLLKISVNAKKK